MRMKIIYFFNNLFLHRIWSTFSGIWVKVEGREKIIADKTYVFVANHSNALDIAFTGSCINHYYKPLVKKELLSTPVLGQLLRMTSLAVDRKDAESRKKSTIKMIDWLKNGLSLLIFPEGTRNRTELPLKEFYDGAFKVAIESKASIAPIVLINIRGLQEATSLMVKPGLVTMRFLDPIDTTNMTNDDVESLKNKVHQQIEAILVAEDKLYKK